MKKSVFVFLCCMVFLTFEAGGTWAQPQMWCVSNAADLQTALTNAVLLNEGIFVVPVDNVIMVVQGTYTGNFTYNSNSGTSITLQGGYTAGCVSRVFNPAKTVLDGNHAGVVLSLQDTSGGNISVEEFTIRNGNNNNTEYGGGVFANSYSSSGTGGTITFSGNTFTGNISENVGGGVYAKSFSDSGTGGTITFTENTFTGNYAYSNGGGVYAYSNSTSGAGGPITFTWNTFTGNTADEAGGVYTESYGETGSGQITLTGNSITGNYAYSNGGGVSASSYSTSGTTGAVTLTGNTISGNYAYNDGGGVYAISNEIGSGTGGVITLIENTVTGNYAYDGGGGVYAYSNSDSGTGGAIVLSGNTITGNYAYTKGGGSGVWAYSYSNSGKGGAIALTQNTISGNTAYGQSNGGAGVYIYSYSNGSSATGGTITLTGNTVANNHAYGNGGGVYCDLEANAGTTGALTFEANTITGNIAHDQNGGVFANAYSYSSGTGAITFTNNIIAANNSWSYGGVFAYSYSGSGATGAITLTNNTITKNSDLTGNGGVEVVMSNNTFNCYNNIIWGNTAPSPADIVLSGTGTAYGYNNDYNAMYGSWNGGSAGNIDRDPLFDAGGYYHLTPLSPCINVGDNSAPDLPGTDIDGDNRVIGVAVDIGADEYNGLLIAKAPADSSVFTDLSIINKYQPTFQWIAVEPFKSFEILFSASGTDFVTKGVFITEGSAPGTKSNWTPPIATWEKIMAASYNGGSIRPIYWKVVGTEANKSTADTPVRQFSVGSASQPTILSPAYGTTLPAADNPTFVFLTGYNIKFRLEIWSLAEPTKIIAYTYTVTNPIATPVLEEMLSSSQWTAVKKLIGTNIGNFRIRAWDGINRESDSGPQPFTIR